MHTKVLRALSACAQFAAALTGRGRKGRSGPRDSQLTTEIVSAHPGFPRLSTSRLRNASFLVCVWACAAPRTPSFFSAQGAGVGGVLWAGPRKVQKGQRWGARGWWRTKGMMGALGNDGDMEGNRRA